MSVTGRACPEPLLAADRQRGLHRRDALRLGGRAVAAAFAGLCLHACPALGGTGEESAFRVGFTSSMFADVHQNDARAAIKIWAQLLAAEHGIPIDGEPLIIDSQVAGRMLREAAVNAMGMLVTEYPALVEGNRFDPIFVTRYQGALAERYVLLAHREGAVRRVADLRGRSLLVHDNPRACLASPWLDVVLDDSGLPVATRLARAVRSDPQLAKVVLPVFFRQADAALVTRSGFETLAELNPQLRQKLVVLAESEDIVPAVFAMRAAYASTFRDALLDALDTLDRTAAGRQVLTIFRGDSLERVAPSALDTAFGIIERHRSLRR